LELTAWLLLLAGLAALVTGAELLVRGASRLALRFGTSPLVIGLTVVAFGTSSPELAVSVQSGLAGQADIAVGNVVGSNIFNVLAVLGLAALVAPLVVQQRLVRFEVPLVVGLSVLVLVMVQDRRVGAVDGLLLLGGLIGYTVFAIRQSLREATAVRSEYDQAFGVGASGWLARLPAQVVFVLGGLGLLVLGAKWLVDSAVSIARSLGVGEAVIGLTVVAAGTSFPELATSVVAAMRGERDIAVGNVVGSSVFNLLGILGTAALVTPEGAFGGTGAGVLRRARDDCGCLGLLADPRHRAPHRALGGSPVPWLLRGLRNLPDPCRHRARRPPRLRCDDADVRVAAHRSHSAGALGAANRKPAPQGVSPGKHLAAGRCQWQRSDTQSLKRRYTEARRGKSALLYGAFRYLVFPGSLLHAIGLVGHLVGGTSPRIGPSDRCLTALAWSWRARPSRAQPMSEPLQA
jgi:cation:H+ antiporter